MSSRASMLFVLSWLPSLLWAAPIEDLVYTQTGCPLLERKKYSSAWVASSLKPAPDASVKILAQSTTRVADTPTPAYIFEFPSDPRAAQLEFKAASGCFSPKKPLVVLTSEPTPSTIVRWNLEMVYSQHQEYFRDAATRQLDSVTSKFIGAEIRQMRHLNVYKWTFDVGYGLQAGRMVGTSDVSALNVVDLAALGFGLTATGRLRYHFTQSFSAGVALPVQVRWALWPKNSLGAMVNAVGLRSSALLHLSWDFKASAIYVGAGFSEGLSQPDCRFGMVL